MSDAPSSSLPAKRKKRRRTPQWIKAFGRNEHLREMTHFLIASYIRLVRVTSRWDHIGEEHPQAFWNRKEPFLVAFWHGRILMLTYCWRSDMKMNMLISNHRDGEIIAGALHRFHLGSVRGSSSKNGDKGGARALRTMVKAVRNGESIGITPDGPSGPFMRASEGVVAAAKLAGVPILPTTYAARHRKVMKSWDRFLIARPFTRGVIMWGEPIYVDRKADGEDLEAARQHVEQALIDLTREADLLVGAKPVLPPDETARR